MKSSILACAALVVLSDRSLQAFGQETPSSGIRWEEFDGRTRQGSFLSGSLGRIKVPENHSKPEGAQLELAFVRFESTSAEPGPPIYYLIGGPGVPASRYTAMEATIPDLSLLEFGDVIGVEQRGTGYSAPDDSDAPEFSFSLPLDRVVTREDRVRAQAQSMRECYEYWRDEGHDLHAYNSIESADDVDAVRRALGHEKIILWGTSYGAHLSLAYLRRHQAHVERAVLMKVEGPDQTFKLPSKVHHQLELLHDLVAADDVIGKAMPDLLGTVRGLFEKLRAEPVRVRLEPPGAEPFDVVCGVHDLEVLIALHLGFTEMLVRLPAILHQFDEGEWEMLGMAAMNLRSGGEESPMAMMMDASSGGSAERLERIERERKSGKFPIGDALNFNHYPESNGACGNPDVGDEFRGALECSVPVLFVSGDLDARTPPSNVEEIIGGFSNGVHLLVRGTGHDAREQQSREYCSLVREFLRGKLVKSQEIHLPALEFQPID